MYGDDDQPSNDNINDYHQNKDKHRDKDNKKKSKKENKIWMMEDDNQNVMDFLDPSLTTKRLSATKPSLNKPYFPIDDFGKMLISDEKKSPKKRSRNDDEEEDHEENGHKDGEDDDDDDYDKDHENDDDDDDDDDGKDEDRKKKKINKKKIQQEHPSKRRKFQQQSVPNKKKTQIALHSKNKYQSKKARGDVLQPGKLEPYAYLPLQPKFLNKRNRAKAVNQFKNFSKAKK